MITFEISDAPDTLPECKQVISYYVNQLGEQWLLYIAEDNAVILTGSDIDWNVITTHIERNKMFIKPVNGVTKGIAIEKMSTHKCSVAFGVEFSRAEATWLVVALASATYYIQDQRTVLN